MVLETGDILWFPEDRWVTKRGASVKNRLWPFGHVAMVFFKEEAKQNEPNNPVPKASGTVPYVIEAIKNATDPSDPKGPGISKVREISYKDWFQDFDTFWHGRIIKPRRAGAGGPFALSQKNQMDLVTEALRHLGKPYSALREPSLNRYTRFSCSKLILVAACNALGIALDGKGSEDPKRWWPCQQKA